MDAMQSSVYIGWTIPKLKRELVNRGATTSGRKEDLLQRLEAYDRNKNFQDEPVILPDPVDTDWPESGFHQLQLEHRIHLPKLTKDAVHGYFMYREAIDCQTNADIKAIEKGKKMYESDRIFACSISVKSSNIFFTGIVGAAMKRKVTYSYKLKLSKEHGEIINTHCECPAGKGPHGTCKHIAAVLFMLSDFVHGEDPKVQRSCTEILQTFHKPKRQYVGSPVKAEDLPSASKRCKMDDPRPLQFRNRSGYEDHVRSVVINYCSNKSHDIAVRYLYDRADLQEVVKDHDYLKLPLTEHWVDNALQVSEDKAKDIEKRTKKQAESSLWLEERRWRITASRFGEVCKRTSRRNMDKLCKSFMTTSPLTNKAVIHGRQYESTAVKKFETTTGMKVKSSGLFICYEKPYLAATPDGIVDCETIVEVKCPYAGREALIKPGKCFPFLCYDKDGNVTLKQTSNYFFQIQGQLFITQAKYCYFIVYTFKDFFVQKVNIESDYCTDSLIPKLELFYIKHLRKYIASHMK